MPTVTVQGKTINCSRGANLRRILILGDIRVAKYDGFWGSGDRYVWTPDETIAGQ